MHVSSEEKIKSMGDTGLLLTELKLNYICQYYLSEIFYCAIIT